MIGFFLLACLLHPTFQKSDSDAAILEELVIKGWKEHKVAKSGLLTNQKFPSINLNNPVLSNKGTMRVTLASKHTKTKFADKYVLEATLDNLTTAYNYTLSSGETGQISTSVSNRTYSIKFQSIFVGEVCRTAVIDVKLVMEGPIEITASGRKPDEALKQVEQLRFTLVMASRSFVHFEIMTSVNESLTKRDPKLCKQGGNPRGQRLLKSRNSKTLGKHAKGSGKPAKKNQ